MARTGRALKRAGRMGELGAHVPPDEVDEVRIIGTWLASHPRTPQLVLEPAPQPEVLGAFFADAVAGSARERQLDDRAPDLVGTDGHL